MLEAAKYSAIEVLRNGRRIEIRALRPEDRGSMLAAVDRIGAQSLYRRFFGPRRGFTEQEQDFFVNVDFIDHVALVAIADEGSGPVIVGGGRYVLVRPGNAEVAFAVIDPYHRQGIGGKLMHHLAAVARAGGIRKFIAEVLPENTGMLKVFEKTGFRMETKRESGVVHVVLELL